MGNLKKIMAMLVVFAMLFSMASVSVFAAAGDGGSFAIEVDVNADLVKQGESVEMSIYATHTNPATPLAAYNLIAPAFWFTFDNTNLTIAEKDDVTSMFRSALGDAVSTSGNTLKIGTMAAKPITTGTKTLLAKLTVGVSDSAPTTEPYALDISNKASVTFGPGKEAILSFASTSEKITVIATDTINEVEAVAAVADKTVGTDAGVNGAGLGLPQKLAVTDSVKDTVEGEELDVTWDTSSFNSLSVAEQTITGTVTAPTDAWGFKDDFVQPSVKVTLQPLTSVDAEGGITVDKAEITIDQVSAKTEFTPDEVKAIIEKADPVITVKNGDITDTYETYTVEGAELVNEDGQTATATLKFSGSSKSGIFNLAEITATVTVKVTGKDNITGTVPATLDTAVLGTTVDTLELPKVVAVTSDKGIAKELNVAWNLEGYDPKKLEAQIFEGTVSVPAEKAELWTIADGVKASLTITLQPLTTVDAEGGITVDKTEIEKMFVEGQAGNFTPDEVEAIVKGAVHVITDKNGEFTDTYETYTVEETELANEVGQTATVTLKLSGLSKNGIFNLGEKTATVTVKVTPNTIPFDAENAFFDVVPSGDATTNKSIVVSGKAAGNVGKEVVIALTKVVGEKETALKPIKTVIKEDGTFSTYFTAKDIGVDVEQSIIVSVKVGGATLFIKDAVATADIDIVKSNTVSVGGITAGGGSNKPSTPEEPEKPVVDPVTGFADMVGHWATEAVANLKKLGVINGKTETEFEPEGLVTRAEFAKMIATMFKLEVGSTDSKFADCPADAWYTQFIVAAAEAGYLNGTSETTFGPEDNISRQDICTILGRILEDEAKEVKAFADDNEVADYAKDHVYKLAGLGIVNGYEDGTFGPAKNATRAEAAKILNSVYNLNAAE